MSAIRKVAQELSTQDDSTFAQQSHGHIQQCNYTVSVRFDIVMRQWESKEERGH